VEVQAPNGKYIPSHLPVDDVFRLMDLPDRENPLGLRDLAILEVLYSCGFRVAELVGMNVSSIDDDQRLVKVMGKGDRERLVPIGRQALKAVKAYLGATGELRNNGFGGSGRPALYEFSGGAFDNPQHWKNRQTICGCRRVDGRYQSPQHATYLCDPFAGRWCGSSFRPGASGAQEPCDDSEIYPCEP